VIGTRTGSHVLVTPIKVACSLNIKTYIHEFRLALFPSNFLILKLYTTGTTPAVYVNDFARRGLPLVASAVLPLTKYAAYCCSYSCSIKTHLCLIYIWVKVWVVHPVLDSSAPWEENDIIFSLLSTIYHNNEHEAFLKKLESRIKLQDKEIEKMCHRHYQGFIDAVRELLQVRGEANTVQVSFWYVSIMFVILKPSDYYNTQSYPFHIDYAWVML